MAERTDWSEWGRFTITALCSSVITLGVASFWLGGTVSELHAATESVKGAHEDISALTILNTQMKEILVRVTVISERHDEDIRALKEKVYGGGR